MMTKHPVLVDDESLKVYSPDTYASHSHNPFSVRKPRHTRPHHLDCSYRLRPPQYRLHSHRT